MNRRYNTIAEIPELTFFVPKTNTSLKYPSLYFRVGWTVYELRYGGSAVYPVAYAPAGSFYETVQLIPAIYPTAAPAFTKPVAEAYKTLLGESTYPKKTRPDGASDKTQYEKIKRPGGNSELQSLIDRLLNLGASNTTTPVAVKQPRYVTFDYRKRDAYGRFVVSNYVIRVEKDTPTHIEGHDEDEDDQYKSFLKSNIVGRKITEVTFQ